MGSLPSSQKYHPQDVAALGDWLCAQGLLRVGIGTLLEEFCKRVTALGLPLMRGYIGAQTLHPRISGLGCSWRPEEGINTDIYVYRPEPTDTYLKSPFKRVLDDDLDELRIRLTGNDPLKFPVCEEFRAEGATDYIVRLAKFGRDGEPDGMTGVMSSWLTAAPAGFREEDLALIRELLPKLAIAVQTRISQDISANLLNTYVGSVATKRILDGEIRRGSLEVISSVILLADLRGFTSMSERAPQDDLVQMLNQYFDCLVGPITERGGNVLKFLGDGLLATFPLDGRPADLLCEQALDAANEILANVGALRAERAAAGKEVMALDIALHLGDVFWGNVGSEERLDFTVVGPAVNEAARIEALCSQYERCLLVSETFAEAAASSADRLVSIGRFALRGVRSTQAVYTLENTECV